MQVLKVFVSSPTDVMVERRRIENVISRLNGEFAEVARLEAIRWEKEFYQAYSTFQAQIPRSVDCDLVVGILKWRLGTELPADFPETLPDGQPFPSGTAYEILTAIEKRQKGAKLPDIYLFRYVGSSPIMAIEDPNRAKVEHEWQRLKGFFQEWFLTERGYFKAAFNSYSSEDEFEAQLETLLRKWVADKVAGGRVVLWPIEVKGSPFCGLAAFGSKHTPVFFGRRHDTTHIVDLWREAGSRGSPSLLVLGASGSGKSSLVRAGVIPRLTTPGVIKQVDIWRIAIMRPGDSPAGPFAALAAALMQDGLSLPKEEEGRGPALPEIRQGDSKTVRELAAVLGHAAVGIQPIINALSRVAGDEQKRGRYDREVRCDLVLLIDQFEELFAASVNDEKRTSFIDLMAVLAGTGRIWVAATIRNEFYARMLDHPALKKLKELGATYDLAFPGPVELAETVRAPVEAAGLVFETDAKTGERLDERLLREADHPDMLPLVQLALSRLFEQREREAGDTRLTFKAYQNLGGLKGIIADAGEKALKNLGTSEAAQLPTLIRRLAEIAPSESVTNERTVALTVRSAPLAEAAPDEASRRLVKALVDVRLLMTTRSETDEDVFVRLAHQRVLTDWGRAQQIVSDSAEFYRIRADVESERERWEAANHRSELLLAGLPLSEAQKIIKSHGKELSPAFRAYVKKSQWRAERLTIALTVAVAAFAILSFWAWYETYEANRQFDKAENNFRVARETAANMIAGTGNGLRNLQNINIAAIHIVLDAIDKAIDPLKAEYPDNPLVDLSRAEVRFESAKTFQAAGNRNVALQKAAESVQILSKITNYPYFVSLRSKFENVSVEWRWELSKSIELIGDLHREESKNLSLQVDARNSQRDEARKLFLDALAIRQQLVATTNEKDNTDAYALGISLSNVRLGDLSVELDDLGAAQQYYEQSLRNAAIFFTRNKSSSVWQRELSWNFNKVGDIKLRIAQGNTEASTPSTEAVEALNAFMKSFCIRSDLSTNDRNNTLLKRDVSYSLIRIGDTSLFLNDRLEAERAYFDALLIRLGLLDNDLKDARYVDDVVKSLVKMGKFYMSEDQQKALAYFEYALDTALKFLASAPNIAEGQINYEEAQRLAQSIRSRLDQKLEGVPALWWRIWVENDLDRAAKSQAARAQDATDCWNNVSASVDKIIRPVTMN